MYGKLIVIMLLPVFGVLLFACTQSEIGRRALKTRMNQIITNTKESIHQAEIEEDFQATPAKCRQVTKETVRREKWYLKLPGRLMKVVAPLM